MRAILVPYDPLGTVTLGCFGVLADDDGVMDATAYYSGATLAMASSIDEVAASVDGNTAAVILRLSKLYMEI